VFNLRLFEKEIAKFHNKYEALICFRKNILKKYIEWYDGDITLYNQHPPSEYEKIKLGNHLENSILTWGKLHQERKYLEQLLLTKDAFKGLNVLDIGSGGIPGALAFKDAHIYCLDPLVLQFKKMGYPFQLYNKRAIYIGGCAEKLPFSDKSFDAIISLNALDHIDDFRCMTKELRRVAKNNCKIRLNISYHSPTILEPLELNDGIVRDNFKWCNNFRKIEELPVKSNIADEYEVLNIWSNFNN
jgi:SAM-dependent methyltransferase